MLWDTSYRYVAVPALCRCGEMTGCAQNMPVKCLRELFDSAEVTPASPLLPHYRPHLDNLLTLFKALERDSRSLSASTFSRNSVPASNVCGGIPFYYHVQSASSRFRACPLKPNAQPLLVVSGNDDTALQQIGQGRSHDYSSGSDVGDSCGRDR